MLWLYYRDARLICHRWQVILHHGVCPYNAGAEQTSILSAEEVSLRREAVFDDVSGTALYLKHTRKV